MTHNDFDIAVAEATRAPYHNLNGACYVHRDDWVSLYGLHGHGRVRLLGHFQFNPSVDVALAFEAAEVVNLFDGVSLVKSATGMWRIWEEHNDVLVSDGDTPAIAICKAILKLNPKEML